VNPVQASGANPMIDFVATRASDPELPDGEDSMLAANERRNQGIQVGLGVFS
jgi:hypothetical protein